MQIKNEIRKLNALKCMKLNCKRLKVQKNSMLEQIEMKIIKMRTNQPEIQ